MGSPGVVPGGANFLVHPSLASRGTSLLETVRFASGRWRLRMFSMLPVLGFLGPAELGSRLVEIISPLILLVQEGAYEYILVGRIYRRDIKNSGIEHPWIIIRIYL